MTYCIPKLGFTLIETLCVISLLTLSTLLAFSFSTKIFKSNELDSLTTQLVNISHYGRNMALLNGHDLLLKPYQHHWSYGAILLVKSPPSGRKKILRIWQWHLKFIKLSWDGVMADDHLIFFYNLKHAITNGHFTLSDNNHILRRIVLNRLGRIIVT